jgi:hypothetical protein
MKYVIAMLVFALLVFPVKFLFGEPFLGLLGLGCFLIVYYWPKAARPGERTPGSTS